MTAYRPLPNGITVHAIHSATALGKKRKLAGELIVEMPDGSFHKLTGAEMTEWSDAIADCVKGWRLRDD